MKRHIVLIFLGFFLVFCTLSLSYPQNIHAADMSCIPSGVGYVGAPPAGEFDDPNASVSFKLEGLTPLSAYSLDATLSVCTAFDRDVGGCKGDTIGGATSDAAGVATFNLPNGAIFPDGEDTNVQGLALWLNGPSIESGGCKLHSPYILSTGVVCDSNSVIITQSRNGQSCTYSDGLAGSCLQVPNQDAGGLAVQLQNIRQGGSPYSGKLQINLVGEGQSDVSISNGSSGIQNLLLFRNLPAGDYTIHIEEPGKATNLCTKDFTVSPNCQDLCLDPDNIGEAETLGPDKFNLCEQINDPTAQQKCLDCSGGEDGTEGIWTAVGCINREPEEILGRMIRLGISMGGGIALLMILSAGFTLTVSQGNAQKTAQAKEMITAAITGLLFIIFSVTILQFIGFSILKIPGFGG